MKTRGYLRIACFLGIALVMGTIYAVCRSHEMISGNSRLEDATPPDAVRTAVALRDADLAIDEDMHERTAIPEAGSSIDAGRPIASEAGDALDGAVAPANPDLRVRFAQGTRLVAEERKMREIVEKVIGAADSRRIDIECRFEVCRLSSPPDDGEWINRLQAGAMYAFAGLVVETTPSGLRMFVELNQAPIEHANKLLADILDRLRGSTEVQKCKTSFPVTGERIVFHVELDSSARRLILKTDGAVAENSRASCLQHAAENVISAVPVPDDVSSLPDVPINMLSP